MDIEKELLKEHSRQQTLKIVKYIGDDAQRFNQLIKLFLSNTYRISQRAAWPLSYCVEQHPSLITPHLGKVLKLLGKPEVHDAVKRNIVRFLQYIDIPNKYIGTVADTCFALMDPKEPIAVRVFSMSVLSNIARKEPDLKKELRIIIEDQLPFGSAGFRSRAKKVLKELEK